MMSVTFRFGYKDVFGDKAIRSLAFLEIWYAYAFQTSCLEFPRSFLLSKAPFEP